MLMPRPRQADATPQLFDFSQQPPPCFLRTSRRSRDMLSRMFHEQRHMMRQPAPHASAVADFACRAAQRLKKRARAVAQLTPAVLMPAALQLLEPIFQL
jgi:hypothetical protein